jgi:chromosome segregation ATPase
LGRTTFIVLEKVQHLNSKIDTTLPIPEEAERLLDLIQVKDKKFVPAFYFGVQDTLVTKDLPTATK